MSLNWIGPELEKTGKLTRNKNVNEERETGVSKLNNFEEAQSSISSIKKKYDIVVTYITSTKNKDETLDKVEESRAT